MPKFSFKKGERLSSKKAISSLFQSGSSVTSYPLRFIYSRADIETYPAIVTISVPKRLFKNAVDRNLLKRRIREAYRLKKPEIYSRLNDISVGIHLVIQYNHKAILDYQSIESGLIKGMEKVLSHLNE